MIEKMNLIYLATLASQKEQMLLSVRNLGIVHIKEKKLANPELLKDFETLSKTYQILKEEKGASYTEPVLTDEEFEKLNRNVLDAFDKKKKYLEKLSQLRVKRDFLAPWGNFSTEDVNYVINEGYKFYIYRVGKKEYEVLKEDKNISFILLSPVEKQITIAVLNNKLPSSIAASQFIIPEKSLKEVRAEIEECVKDMKETDEFIKKASIYLSSYKSQIDKCINSINYSSADKSVKSDSDLVWITGYIPESEVKSFKSFFNSDNCAYAICEVENDDDEVPTKVRYSKVSKLMKPVFNILGTVPGYREYDISFWFLCFFALFFAMIIGDAGYGLVFLLIGIILNIKSKKINDTTLLIYVVSTTTIIWGALTGTWFGLEGAMNIPFFRMFVIKSIANYPEYFGNTALNQQNTIMKLCFMIGMVQLVLACFINIKKKIKEKNLSFIADIGWMFSIIALYFVILLLVIGEKVNFSICGIMVGIGFILVTLFGGMNPSLPFSKGLKAGLSGAFTNFLNTISSFGNIMSYIRLFAVGLASLAIAQSFNDMALSLNGVMRVFGYLIFILGHTLNIVMGILSVVVHGVRLNLLEFSGQLGMEWSGIEYDPFRVQNGGIK